MVIKVELFGEQAMKVRDRIGLASNGDQSPFKGIARLHYIEGRAVIELELP